MIAACKTSHVHDARAFLANRSANPKTNIRETEVIASKLALQSIEFLLHCDELRLCSIIIPLILRFSYGATLRTQR